MESVRVYYCLFDGSRLNQYTGVDALECHSCGMTYSGPFLQAMEQERNLWKARERSRAEHPATRKELN